jgi:hypothetical protein
MIRTSRCTCFAIVLAGCVGWGATVYAAQPPTRNAGADAVETSGMRCWWETGTRAVHIGEPFGLVLTCRVMETDRVRVVPTLTELEPTSIELTPFEVLEGSRHEDIVVAPWRYLQYQYTVRLLGDEFFGRDIAIPATNVTFRIQTGGAETVEGTEHRYVLPAMPIRILSLLPAQAADIRDPAVDTFADLEARRFRATMELVASAIFFGFAVIPAVVAALRVRERFRKGDLVVEETVAARTVLNACVREIESARADALRDGWTSGLAGRAFAPLRVAAAIALKQTVAQTMVTGDTPTREGQVPVRHGLLRRRRALVSASITAEAMDRLRAAGNATAPGDSSVDVLDPIREALAALNAVRYGRVGRVDVQALDRTLEDGCRALRRLRKARLWPARAAAALPKPATLFGTGAWSR